MAMGHDRFRYALALAWLAAGSVAAQNPSTTVTVDAKASRRLIDPKIYGVAFATTAQLADLNAPLNRWGGNTTTRHNWQLNASNHASDYYFESIDDGSAVAGAAGDAFVNTSKAGGAQPMLTIPMIGWVARLGPARAKLGSFSVAKYGPQCSTDPYFPDAGNGIHTDCTTPVAGNDPNDASILVNSTYQQQWVQHLVTTFGNAASGGVAFYLLDNEPSIWFSTHRDVAPTGMTMDQTKAMVLDYSAKIRAIDPIAHIAGPEEWGWSGYFYSGYDQQWGSIHGWSNLPDRIAHGGQDYLPWMLGQLKQSAIATGQRPIDIFSVHYYPQGGEFGDDVSTAMQLLRNQSTRSLWDPDYVDQSWINDTVELIPRLRSWADAFYFPGTPIGITEYNWGAENHINGATTQADIFGIFGREGLSVGTRWTTPATGSVTYRAMKMYRNYDGSQHGFGDIGVSAAVANPDNLSAFAALRASDGALTVMIVNKVLSGNTPLTVALNKFVGTGTAQVWQLTSTNAITRLADTSYSAGSLSVSVPPQSITLLVLPAGMRADLDVFWRRSDGTDATWQFTGQGPTQFLSAFPPGVSTSWQAIGTGDVTGDGLDDVVWFQPATGQVAIWLMSSPASVGSVTFPASVGPGSPWVLSAVGDVNGDGHADLVWRNSVTGQTLVWYLNAAGALADTKELGLVSLSYELRGVGDFNGDGIYDLLWFSPSDGQVAVWLMAADGTYTATFPAATGPGSWRPYRLGDFDGDGKCDIFWRNEADGSTAVWYMAGGAVADFDFFVGAPIAAWQLGTAGDFDLDGRTDLMWYGSGSGSVVRWLMKGRHVMPTAQTVGGIGTGWQMVP